MKPATRSAIVLCACLATGSAWAPAATITNASATWPTAPDVQTVDALNVATFNNRGISGARVDRQSFRVPGGVELTIGTIVLSSSNYNNNAFIIRFFESTDTNNTSGGLTGSIQVGNTITVAPFGSTVTGGSNLEIVLDPSEQITLPAVTSPAGYVMAISLADTTTPAAFNWVHSNISGSDLYPDGRMRRDDGDTTNYRDFGLALLAATTSPATPGDYNGDGFVDSADYTVWADHFGQTGTGLPGDGNGDGVVDSADYTVWADHFGQGIPPTSPNPPAASVPEPAGLLLALPALALLASRRRV